MRSLRKVNDLWLEVVGVAAAGGGGDSFQGVAVGPPAREIYMPASTAMRKLDRDVTRSPLDEVVVRLGKAASPRDSAAVAGAAMGIVIAWVVAASAGWPTVVTLFSVVLSFGVSIAVGLAAGIYPAVRAASLDPIEALRYE